jgi:hypothetical protein
VNKKALSWLFALGLTGAFGIWALSAHARVKQLERQQRNF